LGQSNLCRSSRLLRIEPEVKRDGTCAVPDFVEVLDVLLCGKGSL